MQALSFRIPHGSAGLGFALDVMLSALLVLPPAVLMGGTIPILTQALARSLEDATRFHALVYAFNTAGAFAGALAAGYWLVPSLGPGRRAGLDGRHQPARRRHLPRARLAAPAGGGAGRRAPAREVSLRGAGWFSFAAVALLVGFAMMTLQTVLIRLGGLSFGSSQFTFSMVVAVFVLCIALGSFAVSALPRIPAFLLPACSVDPAPAAGGALPRRRHRAVLGARAARALPRSSTQGFYPYQARSRSSACCWCWRCRSRSRAPCCR